MKFEIGWKLGTLLETTGNEAATDDPSVSHVSCELDALRWGGGGGGGGGGIIDGPVAKQRELWTLETWG